MVITDDHNVRHKCGKQGEMINITPCPHSK